MGRGAWARHRGWRRIECGQGAGLWRRQRGVWCAAWRVWSGQTGVGVDVWAYSWGEISLFGGWVGIVFFPLFSVEVGRCKVCARWICMLNFRGYFVLFFLHSWRGVGLKTLTRSKMKLETRRGVILFFIVASYKRMCHTDQSSNNHSKIPEFSQLLYILPFFFSFRALHSILYHHQLPPRDVMSLNLPLFVFDS